MNAMEQMAVSMLAKMTGLGPEEMQQMAAKGMSILQTLETRLTNIENLLIEIRANQTNDIIDVPLTAVKELSDGRQSGNTL